MPHRSESSTHRKPDLNAAVLRATPDGTRRYSERFNDRFTAAFFAPTTLGLTVSHIGIGTYLGESNDTDDAAYEAAVRHAVASGINLIDTAINYRSQRSEQAVGSAIQQVLSSNVAARDELVICTKGGFIPFDGTPPANRDEYLSYVRRQFIDSQILTQDEIVAGGHSLAPRFLRYCLAKSRQNLGLRSIDLYYLHNPELQLNEVEPEEFERRIRAAFECLESAVERGEIGAYGCSTWDGLRVPPSSKPHLSLERLIRIARELAGDRHHFRAVQLPVNVAMLEAVNLPTQQVDGRLMPVVQAAEELGLSVISSAPLLQGKLASALPDALRQHFTGLQSDAQRALAFVRSLPAISATLLGTKQASHVDEILAIVRSAS